MGNEKSLTDKYAIDYFYVLWVEGVDLIYYRDGKVCS